MKSNGGEAARPATLNEVWASALRFALSDSRVLADVDEARKRDPLDATEADFMRECAWAIFGARRRYVVLGKIWPEMEKAFLHWSVRDIVLHRTSVRGDALLVLNSPRKIDAVIEIAVWLRGQGWEAVHSKLLEYTSHDEHGNIAVTPELLVWLDHLPEVGTVLAAYIAKNLGVSSIKDDVWIRRLASWLGYTPDAGGVWEMAERVQATTGEKVNVIDTVLWNWARKQDWLAEGRRGRDRKERNSPRSQAVSNARGHTIIATVDDTAAWEEDAMNAGPGDKCWFCLRARTEAERQQPHGLCHDCFHLRRMVRRARRCGSLPVPAGSNEKKMRDWLCGR